ncbi:MAG: hypothetical protein ACE5LB_10040 [Acidiferrobacterales bacterium]
MHAVRAIAALGVLTTLVAYVLSARIVEQSTAGTIKSILSLKEARALLGDGVVGKRLPSTPVPDTRTLLPNKPGTWTYNVVSGKDSGKTRTKVLQRATDPDHPNLWQRHDPGNRVFSMEVTDQSTTVSSLAVHAHNLLIEYLSGEPLLKKGMKPGETIGHRTDVKAVKLSSPSHTRSTGFLEISVTYMGRMKVKTPAGTFDAYLVRRDFKSEVSPVKQTDTIYTFYAENVGIVALVSHLDVHAAFIYHQDTRTAMVLASPPEFQ